jgi:hypothetical protein
MTEDELFEANVESQAQLWAPTALVTLAGLKHQKRQRYEELLVTLRGRKVSRLTQLDREVDKAIAAAKKRHEEASRESHSDDGFERDEDGKIRATPGNVRLALDRMGVKLRYDTFRDVVVVEGLDGYGPVLDDHGENRLWLGLSERFGFLPRRDFFSTVVADAAYQDRFNPVVDYLAGLEWDGTPRLDTWLTVYAGAEDSVYTKAVGRLMLVAAVRRVRRPGVKFDEALVAEGTQGSDKSSGLKTLAVNPDWFTDSVPLNADDKKLLEQTRGKWIVEVADLHGASKAEIEAVKAMMSRSSDRARMAYGRLTTERPRQFVIFGTTNDERYLADATGNRRFWPVRVTRFDVEALERDRDQLWAEAAQAEEAGESIRLDPSLYPVAVLEQEQRVFGNPFVDVLAEALQERDGVLYQTVAYNLLGIPPERRTPKSATMLKRALTILGYSESNRREHGHQITAFARGGPDERRRFEVVTDIAGRRRLAYRGAAQEQDGAGGDEE